MVHDIRLSRSLEAEDENTKLSCKGYLGDLLPNFLILILQIHAYGDHTSNDHQQCRRRRRASNARVSGETSCGYASVITEIGERGDGGINDRELVCIQVDPNIVCLVSSSWEEALT